MKQVLLLWTALLLLACNHPTPTPDDTRQKQDTTHQPQDTTHQPQDTTHQTQEALLPIRGADLSWITEQEQMGVLFYDSLAQPQEVMSLLKSYGMTAVRLRVWVNHSTGWCNLPDVLVKAKRAAELGLNVMIDFHYSDYFADPSKQNKPAAWKNCPFDALRDSLVAHTTTVLSALQKEGVTPAWVQIGNETRNGMLWPTGQLWNNQGDLPDGWKNYAALTTAGYDATKAIFPDAIVVVHIDNAYENNNWFFRKMKANGGKFDAIGLSHYPMMQSWSGKNWKEMNKLALNNIKLLHGEFNCPIMLSEIGTLSANAQVPTAVQVITDLRAKLDTLPYYDGAFYWEPTCYNNWKPTEYAKDGWGAYNMGAFTSTGQPNQALIQLWQH